MNIVISVFIFCLLIIQTTQSRLYGKGDDDSEEEGSENLKVYSEPKVDLDYVISLISSAYGQHFDKKGNCEICVFFK
jgi:hypothetical protein